MKFLLLLTLFASGKPHEMKLRPSCILIRDFFYEKTLLARNINVPCQLSIDYSTNTLFFSYTRTHVDHNARMRILFELGFLNLKTKHLGYITGVDEGFSTAVNNLNEDVYVGGTNGIFRLNEDSNIATNLDIIDSTIWQMFYRDGLYFTTYPEKGGFLYKDGYVEEIIFDNESKVRMLALKKDGIFVFSNVSGLYSCNQTSGKVLHLGNYTITGFTTDVHNNLYFSTINKIYYAGDKIEELADLGDIYGLAIAENGDFIYATKNNIYRLKPTKKKCYM